MLTEICVLPVQSISGLSHVLVPSQQSLVFSQELGDDGVVPERTVVDGEGVLVYPGLVVLLLLAESLQ